MNKRLLAIRVKCVECGHREVTTSEDTPMCGKCGGPMAAIKAFTRLEKKPGGR
jgi:hypothetical protein